ncbi:MAG: hypothetical protein KDI75_06920 [Xanthomonadales bacterium]|nr:hypothetical protein [Xanthomonadales bacterium]
MLHRMMNCLVTAGLVLAFLATPPAHGFGWANCGGPDASISVSSLNLAPETWVAGGEASVTIKVESRHFNVSSADVYRVRVVHRVNGRLLPCLDALTGSCEYNLCQTLEQHFGEIWGIADPVDCPVTNSNCKCPFAPGTYSINPPGMTFAVPDRLERFRGHNDVRITATHESLGVERFCLDLSFDILP